MHMSNEIEFHTNYLVRKHCVIPFNGYGYKRVSVMHIFWELFIVANT